MRSDAKYHELQPPPQVACCLFAQYPRTKISAGIGFDPPKIQSGNLMAVRRSTCIQVLAFVLHKYQKLQFYSEMLCFSMMPTRRYFGLIVNMPTQRYAGLIHKQANRFNYIHT